MVRKLCVAALLTCGIATAQSPNVPKPPCATPQSLAFKSVSIQPSRSSTNHSDTTTEGLYIQGATLRSLLQFVFSTTHTDGVPDWKRFDVTATIDPDDCCRWLKMSDAEQARALRPVLLDRFHLQWHYETRLLPGFALVVAKGGPKFQPAPRPVPEITQGGIRSIVSMKEFTESLSAAIGAPVLDQTGLTGTYRLDVPRPPYYGGRDVFIDASGHPVGGAVSPSVAIADELKPQLGLTLKYGAKVPVEFLVIDHIEPPAEN